MDVPQTLAADVGIDLRRADGGVAEQFLDHAQVGAMLQQVGGEAVPQHVRGDVPRNGGLACPMFDPFPKGHSGKGRTALGEEEIGRGFARDEPRSCRAL